MGYLRTSTAITGGKLIATKHYTNWRYSVAIASDGAIQVQPGDWLSKYSAAIHGDYAHINEYARRNPRTGALEPIQNVNLIKAGETLYHLPTFYGFGRPTPPPTLMPAPARPRAEEKAVRREEIKRMLGASRVPMPGESAINDYLDAAEGVTSGVEVVSIFVGSVEGAVGASAIASAGVAIAPIFLSAVGNFLNFWQDRKGRYAQYGLVGQCYAITAWGFGDTVPPSCKLMLDRAIHDADVVKRAERSYNDSVVSEMNETWANVTSGTVRKLQEAAFAIQSKTKSEGNAVESLRAMVRAIGKGDRAETCKNLMLEVQHTRSFGFVFEWENKNHRRAWDSLVQEIRYPN